MNTGEKCDDGSTGIPACGVGVGVEKNIIANPPDRDVWATNDTLQPLLFRIYML